MTKLSVVIPVFNEQRTIEELLKKVLEVRLSAGVQKEVIVINDGSSDRTLEILERYKNKIQLITSTVNRGKGYAVRQGFKVSTGDLVIIQDGDLEYDPSDYIKLILAMTDSRADAVYGTRLQNYPLRVWGSRRTPMPIHWVSNRFLTGLTNLMYGSKLSDMETCYKLIRKSALEKLTLRADHFDIEPEITAKLLKNSFRIIEIPIQVKPRGYKAGKKIGWKDGIQAIWSIIKYRYYD